MQQSQSPLSPEERYEILDVLRGFALLGVMIDNLFVFTGWSYASMERMQTFPTWPADGILGALEHIFIAGKFYCLFSLLFGIGFSIILSRNEARGRDPMPLFFRRLSILLLMGLAHLFLLWDGDILFLYALLGFTLPLFRRVSDRNLLIIAIALVLFPIVSDGIAVLLHFRPGHTFEELGLRIDAGNGVPEDKDGYSLYLFREDSGWREWRNWQSSGWAYRISYLVSSNRIPKVLAMFLLGLYVGRKMIYVRLPEHVTRFRKIRLMGLLIGIPMGLLSLYGEFMLPGIPDPRGLIHTTAYALSVVPMSLAYASMLCLLWIRTGGNNPFRYLGPLGQMALTHYLLQTCFAILIYYGVGLGLGGNIGPSLFIPIGLVFYFIQVLFSNIWMRYFRFGPMEWIWRQLTYGKPLPLRR